MNQESRPDKSGRYGDSPIYPQDYLIYWGYQELRVYPFIISYEPRK